MQTCSNCGSEVREGARFCTACGSRLNAPAPTNEGGSTWASAPVDNTADPEATIDDQVASTDVESDHPETDAETQGTAERQAPIEVESPTWTWGSAEANAATDNDSADDDAVGSTAEPEVEPEEVTNETVTPDTVASEPQDRSASTFNWTWNPPVSADVTAPVDDAVAEAAGEDQPASVDDAPSPTVDEDRDSGNDSLGSWASTWSDPAARQDVAETAPESADLAAASITEPDKAAFAMSSADEAMATDGGSGDGTRARAEQLLDELRGLLPALSAAPASTGTVGSGHDHAAIVQDLDSARNTVADPTEMRTALEASRDNPRDITTIMDLAGRSNDLLRVLDDRDRLVAAIARAIAALG